MGYVASEQAMSEAAKDQDSGRRVRSYVVRQGRITPSQRRALEDLFPRYGLDPAELLNPEQVFGRQAPLFLEIGFGNGETLAQMAANRNDQDFLGIEVHPPGVGHLLLALEKRGLSNVRIYRADAVEVLAAAIPDQLLDGVRIFFPDPWQKKKHHKRRLINSDFVRLVVQKLKPGGTFHAATDWQDYAEQMLAVLGGCEQLRNCSETGGFSGRPDYRPLTKFERRGQRLGHAVWDLVFARIEPSRTHLGQHLSA